MDIPEWLERYEAMAYHNPPGSQFAAHVLMVGGNGGWTIADVDNIENAEVIANAINLYAQVMKIVRQQEKQP